MVPARREGENVAHSAVLASAQHCRSPGECPLHHSTVNVNDDHSGCLDIPLIDECAREHV